MNIEAVCKTRTHNKLYKLPLGSIKANGWLKEQLDRSADGMGGHLDEIEPEMIGLPFITGARETKLNPQDSVGWSTEQSGTYWTGLIELAYVTGNPELIKKAENWVDGVMKNAYPDGYFGGYTPEDNRNEDYNAWGTNWGIRAMLSFYEATKREDVLEAVHKCLLWFVNNWTDNRTEYCGCNIIDSMIIVYTYTGDERLLKWAVEYIDWLNINSNWPNRMSDFLSEELHYNSMHAVAYGEWIKNPAIIYCANSDEIYLKASLNAIKKVLAISQKNGTLSSNNEYISPISAIHETEYCNFVTYLSTYSWMAMITGDASYGDLMEKILFNGAQGARKKDERAIAYSSAPNQIFATKSSSNFHTDDAQAYAPNFRVACCPTQSVRIVPEFVRSLCMCDDDENLYFPAYGPCKINYKNITLCEDTLYPFRDTIRITVEEAENVPLTMNFKIPLWCKAAVIDINGEKTNVSDSGYYPVSRIWNKGDVVTLTFPMEVAINRVNDKDGAAKYPLSVEYGPLLFAYQIPEKWEAYEGAPVNKVPDWSWFNVSPDFDKLNINSSDEMYKRFNKFSWNIALDEDIDINSVQVTLPDSDGYVWEEPKIKLKIPVYKAKYAYATYPYKTQEVYESPLTTQGNPYMVELVPYGCTALRISYFPRAKKI